MRCSILALTILVLSLACNRKGDSVIVAANTSRPSITQPQATTPPAITSTAYNPDGIETPAPTPPSITNAEPWLTLKEVETDLAIGRINTSTGDFSKAWFWPMNAEKPTRFGNRHASEYGRPGSGFDRPSWASEHDGDSIGVYSMHGQWCLIHSETEGWGWLLIRDEELPGGIHKGRWSIYDEVWRNALVRIKNPHPKTETDGSALYGPIDRIQPLPGEILRDLPDEKGQNLGLVSGKYFKMTDVNGDWVQIQEASKFTYVESQSESSGFLRIFWNPKRSGWIRWKVPGPIPGSSYIRLRGLEYYGYEK